MCFWSASPFCFALLPHFHNLAFSIAILATPLFEGQIQNLFILNPETSPDLRLNFVAHHSNSRWNPGDRFTVRSVQCAVCRVLGYRPKAPLARRAPRFNMKVRAVWMLLCKLHNMTQWKPVFFLQVGGTRGLKTRRTEVGVCTTSAAATDESDSRDSSLDQMTSCTSSPAPPRVPQSNVSFARLDSLLLAQAH